MTIQKTQVLLLIFLMFSQLSLTQANFRAEQSTGINKCDFRSDMRKLWEDHITWTRALVVAKASDSPSFKLILERLIKNQNDIGKSIQPFFGDEAGRTLTNLLVTHVTLAEKIIDALKHKDSAVIEAHKSEWFKNSEKIAEYLNSLNPELWPTEAGTFLLNDYLSLNLRQMEAQAKGDWASSIDAYEKIHEEVLQLSDAFAYGIYKRFPEKFAEP